jgi:hypothetical protein
MVRKIDRLRFPEAPGAGEVAFDFESLVYLATDRKFNVAPDGCAGINTRETSSSTC